MSDNNKDILELAESGKLDEAVQKVLEFKNLNTQIDFLKQLTLDILRAHNNGQLSKDGQELITLLDQSSRRRDNFRVQMLYLDKAKNITAQAMPGDNWQSKLLQTSLEKLVEKLEKRQKPKVFSHVEEVKPDEATPPDSKVFKAFQFTGVNTLTPQTLHKYVAPYLQGLADLQQILCELKNEACPEPHIFSIKEDAPLRVDVNGLSEAVTMALEIIIPYRRQNAKKLAQYAVIYEQLDAYRGKMTELEADLHQEAPVDNEMEEERQRFEIQLISTEIERLQQENQKLESEKRRLEFEIGRELAQEILSDVSEEDRAKYSARLASAVTRLAASRIEPLKD